MPIKPENKALYPSNWKQIRAQILERDGHKCIFCKVPNYALISRDTNLGLWKNMVEGDVHNDINGEESNAIPWNMSAWEGDRARVIILTIAHLEDPNPANCDPKNLGSACQRCHNRLDAKMRAQNRKKTLEANKHPNQLKLL